MKTLHAILLRFTSIFEIEVDCPRCHGHGTLPLSVLDPSRRRVCPFCNAEGRVLADVSGGVLVILVLSIAAYISNFCPSSFGL